jgi:hypothetical protein
MVTLTVTLASDNRNGGGEPVPTAHGVLGCKPLNLQPLTNNGAKS